MQSGTPETGEAIRYDDDGSQFTAFGNLTISRSTFTGGGGVYLNTESGTSTVTVEDSDFAISNPYTGASLLNDDGVPFRFSVMAPITVIDQSADNSAVSKFQIQRNTLSAVSDRAGEQTAYNAFTKVDALAYKGGHLAGIALSHLPAGSTVSGNTLKEVSSSGSAMNAYGIYVDGNSKGIITRNQLQGIMTTAEHSDAAGIHVGTLHGSLDNNQFTTHETTGAAVLAKGDAHAIHVMNDIATTGVIRMNDIMKIESNDGGSTGIAVGHFYYKVDGSKAVDEESDDNYDNLELVVIGDVNGAITENSFAGIEATTGNAYGVYVLTIILPAAYQIIALMD